MKSVKFPLISRTWARVIASFCRGYRLGPIKKGVGVGPLSPTKLSRPSRTRSGLLSRLPPASGPHSTRLSQGYPFRRRTLCNSVQSPSRGTLLLWCWASNGFCSPRRPESSGCLRPPQSLQTEPPWLEPFHKSAGDEIRLLECREMAAFPHDGKPRSANSF